VIKRLSSLLLLMIATAWLASLPAWNSLMAFAVALVGYITVEVVQHNELVKKSQERSYVSKTVDEQLDIHSAPKVQSSNTTEEIVSVTSPPPLRQEAVRLCSLTHRQISEAIEAIPPFQQAKVHESFVGATVTWITRLSAMHHIGDKVTVTAEIPEGSGCLFCRTDVEHSEVFNLAPKGTRFMVTGKIKNVSRYEVELVGCTFQILKEEADQPIAKDNAGKMSLQDSSSESRRV
jgi:hypothetical protein